MKDHYKLAAAVADISAEQSQDKINRKKEEYNKVKAKKYKKRKDTAEFEMNQTATMPSLLIIMAKFRTGKATVSKDFDKMNNGTLVGIIVYYYNSRPKGLIGFNETKIIGEVMKFNDPTGP